MCKSLLQYLIPFNLIMTLVAVVGSAGNWSLALEFSLIGWVTTAFTLLALNRYAKRAIGPSASC